jgi:hypothetical protein
MHRLITCEAHRRPEFGRYIDHALRKPRVCAIAAILRRCPRELRVIDIETAAEQLWDLTLDSCLGVASLGLCFSPEQVEKHAGAVVDVFLSGVRRPDTLRNGPAQ